MEVLNPSNFNFEHFLMEVFNPNEFDFEQNFQETDVKAFLNHRFYFGSDKWNGDFTYVGFG